mmetsp:Transcript_56910/g.123135  ORF Transcript_56910/g.123135 Transcript_56910/m.123135 type:complete len:248 (+) Transcript_56910:1473-2216(+)
MLLEVSPESILEVLRTQVGVCHSDHGGTLTVGYGVENLLDLLCTSDGHLDGVRASQSIQPQRAGLGVGRKLIPHAVVGKDLIRHVVFAPRRKALVEPEVVPPCHGHQVPEPLMSQLVRHYDAHSLHLLPGCTLLDEEVHLAVGHKAPVLHGTCGKLGNGHHIELWQRIGDAKVVIVAIQRLGSHLQGEGPGLRSPRGSVDPNKHAVLGLRLQKVELTHNEGEEVGGHLRRVHESQLGPLTAVDELSG